MANTSVPGNFAIRSAFFATVAILCMAGAAHAETGATGSSNTAPAGKTVSADSKQPSGWGDASAYQGNSYTKESSPSGETTAGWQPAGQGTGSCRHSHPDQEDFLCKLIRIFYGPDSSGPNRDMDNNISAGGAGG